MSAPAPTVVGVDVGSQSCRAIALDEKGAVIASSHVRYPDAGTRPIGMVDPETWLTGVRDAITDLGGVEPASLGIGGYGPCTVADTGEAALTFRYPIGESSDPRDQHLGHAKVLRELLGSGLQPVVSWDWLIRRLGGDSGFQSVWPGDDPVAGFGEAVPVGMAVGTTSGDSGLPPGMLLVPASNDGYLTAWAAGIDRPGLGFDPGGRTGGLGVAVAADAAVEAGPYGIPSAVPGVKIVGGPVAAHGAMLDWWAGVVGVDVKDALESAASVGPGSEGVMVLPFLEGERAPRWNTALRAEILGLHSSHSAAVVTRAILESTAYGLAHLAGVLKDQGVVLERLVCCGRPSTSDLWVSIKAAVLEVPVDVPEHREMAAYGAALAAGAALDWWPKPGGGKSGDWPTPPVHTIEPHPSEVYRAQLARFIALGDVAEDRAAALLDVTLSEGR